MSSGRNGATTPASSAVSRIKPSTGPVITSMGKQAISCRPSRHPHNRYIDGLRQRDGAAARSAIADDIRGNADVYSSFLPVRGDEVTMPLLLQPIVAPAAAPEAPRAARTGKPQAVAASHG